MKFSFPQDPTNALSAMRRADESSATANDQSDRGRQQDLALVGQTVPMIYGHRHDWGNDLAGKPLGTNGGIWYSPRLIGLYPKALLANLLFLVSQGEVADIKAENVYYGYNKLASMTSDDYVIDKDGNVVIGDEGQPVTERVEPHFAYAYETVPEGIESVYSPGGGDELRIPNVRPREEFPMRGFSFTTNESTERLQIAIRGDLHSYQTGNFVDRSNPPDRTYTKATTCTVTYPKGSPRVCTPTVDPPIAGYSESRRNTTCETPVDTSNSYTQTTSCNQSGGERAYTRTTSCVYYGGPATKTREETIYMYQGLVGGGTTGRYNISAHPRYPQLGACYNKDLSNTQFKVDIGTDWVGGPGYGGRIDGEHRCRVLTPNETRAIFGLGKYESVYPPGNETKRTFTWKKTGPSSCSMSPPAPKSGFRYTSSSAKRCTGPVNNKYTCTQTHYYENTQTPPSCNPPQPSPRPGYKLVDSGSNFCSYNSSKNVTTCSRSWTFHFDGRPTKTVCTTVTEYEAGEWWNDRGPNITVEFDTFSTYRVTIRLYNEPVTNPPRYDKTFNLRIANNGTYALPDINLPPETYKVDIEQTAEGWDSAFVWQPIPNNYQQDQQVLALDDKRQAVTNSAGKSPGRGVIDAEISVTETIYMKIEYPEVPGGGDQTAGTWQDLTLAGIKASINALKPVGGVGYWVQTHIFVEQGILVDRLTPSYFSDSVERGPSCFYGDLIYYLLDKSKVIQTEQIDRDSLVLANQVHARYKMFYNGVLEVTQSFAEWVTRTAPYFLMAPSQKNGKYGLHPVVPVDPATKEFSRQPIETYLKATLTADEIVAGSYSRAYVPMKEREDICMVMVYHDQPIASPGQTVTIEVRYQGTALKGPWQQHDMTEFCCHPFQALYAARYLLAKRRHTTHRVSMTVGRRGALLNPGDVVAVDLDVQTSTGDGITDLHYYTIESLSEGQAGQVELELVHFPTITADGKTSSLIAKEIYESEVSVQ